MISVLATYNATLIPTALVLMLTNVAFGDFWSIFTGSAFCHVCTVACVVPLLAILLVLNEIGLLR